MTCVTEAGDLSALCTKRTSLKVCHVIDTRHTLRICLCLGSTPAAARAEHDEIACIVSILMLTWKMIAAKDVMTGTVMMLLMMPHRRAACI